MSRPGAVRRRRGGAAAAIAALATLAFAGPAHADGIPAPANVVVSPDGPSQATSITASWTVPEGVPDGATAHWELCPADVAPIPSSDNGCGSDQAGDAPASTPSITIPTPVAAPYTLWVWFEDGDEQQGTPVRRHVMIDRTAPKAPTDVLRNDGFVRWTTPVDGGAPIARVYWRFCRGWAGFGEQCLDGAGPAETFPLSDTAIPLGPPPAYCIGNHWTVMLWLEDAAGNIDRDPRNAGGTGGGETPLCLPDPGPKPEVPTTPRAKTSLTVGRRVRAVGTGNRRRHRVTLTATAKPANVGGVVRFQVSGDRGERTLTRTRKVRLANGRASFSLTVPKGFRRLTVTTSYAGSETHAPSSRTKTVRIPRR